jgi:hypothetical protein
VATASGLAITTKSQSGSCCCMRKDSRASRFNRFLSTALFAARREIVNPSRGTLRAFGRASTVKKPSDERTASAKTRPNSVEVCRRWRGENPDRVGGNGAPSSRPVTASDERALFAGGSTVFYVHRELPFGNENRGCVCDAGCWVGRFFSWRR